MAGQVKEILSEHVKDMAPEERKELQEKVNRMTKKELETFRNSVDADCMGFFGEEGTYDDKAEDQ